MKTPAVLALLGLLAAASAAASAIAAEKTLETVASLSRGRETPVTARTAPSSGLSPVIAHYVAAQISPMVPGTEVFAVVPTGSMRPAFDDNTLLLTEPAAFADLEIGDIIVFRHTGTGARVVHRIVERRKGGYWTKGDHNLRMDDELVTEANYIARVYGILYTSRTREPLPDALRKNQTLTAAAR
jgi:signal peptidase I